MGEYFRTSDHPCNAVIEKIQALSVIEELNPRLWSNFYPSSPRGSSLVKHGNSYLIQPEDHFFSRRNNFLDNSSTCPLNVFRNICPPSYSIASADCQARRDKRGRPRKQAPKADIKNLLQSILSIILSIILMF